MIPASTNGGGQCFAFPDVCKTPTPAGPVPIPYPNIAMCTDLNTGTCPSKVKIVKKFPATLQSKITQSAGDEAGSAGGVVSGCTKGEAVYTTGYPKVMLQGKVAAFLTSVTTQNKMNIVGAQIAPSQTKVLYSPVPVAGTGQSVSGSADSTTQKLRKISQVEENLEDVVLELLDADGLPVINQRVNATFADGRVVRARTDDAGKVTIADQPKGAGDVVFEVVELDGAIEA